MPTGIYNRKKSTLCNLCGLHPKYPYQGLCRSCYFKKIQLQSLSKRKSQNNSVENLPNEKWVDIEGADGYQISNMGRLKSKNYRCRLKLENGINEKLLKLRPSRTGSYLKADLDKYEWRPSVHRLVALYFVPNPNNYPIVLHRDENKQNNKASNLIWGTHSKNNQDYEVHRLKNGLPRIKLNKELAVEIFNSTNSVQQLSDSYNVTPATIWSIKTGRTWSHATGIPNSRKYKTHN